MVDQIFIFAMIGLSIIAIISAFFVLSHPVFYIFIAILLGFLAWINAVYADIYEAFATEAEVITIAEKFVIIPHVMRWFPAIMLVLSIFIAIIMCAKK